MADEKWGAFTSGGVLLNSVTGVSFTSGVDNYKNTFALTPTVNAISSWDANKNFSANNFLSGYTTTATAAALTTLLVGSPYFQFFTGSTTQTVKMPVTSTLALGQSWLIVNNSSGVVTVESSGANSIQAMAANTSMLITCILTSGTTASSWQVVTYSVSDTTYPLSLALGGTGAALTASAGAIPYSGASALALSAVGSSGQLFQSAGTSAPGWTTSTYPATNAINTLLYASGANTMAALATANNGILVTSSGGVPSIGNTVGADLVIHGVTVGLGGGSVATNTVVSSGGMAANSTGARNTIFGYSSGESLVSATDCTYIGANIAINATGSFNTIVGSYADELTVTGAYNAIFGYNTAGSATGAVTYNTIVGTGTLLLCSTAFSYNAILGGGVLENSGAVSVLNNALVGYGCFDTGAAINNSCVGYESYGLATGASTGNVSIGTNCGVGSSSGTAITSPSYCTLLGFETDSNNATAVGVLAIGAAAIADVATGSTSSDNGAGIAIGSAGYPVGFRGDGTMYPTAGAGGSVVIPLASGFIRYKINGTYYRMTLFPDS